MAKSSYLDRLITGKLPNNVYESRYLSELWNNDVLTPYNSYRYSITNNFTNEVAIAVAGSDYLNNINNNQTVLNMSDPYLSAITLNNEFLPVNRITSTAGNSTLNIKAPADYLPARITAIKGGVASRSIPILFPLSFSRSLSASYAKENPVGSTKPIMAYSYTDGEEIPIEFDALADYLPEGYTSLKDYIEEVLNILRPRTSENVIHEPTVIVEFADMTFRGVCTNINITYDNVYNYRSFVHAKISCQFTRLG